MIRPEWPIVLRALLAIHIVGGLVAFVVAPVALVTAKGGRAHRRAGYVYLWAMVVVGLTALALSIALPILFLAGVSIFSLYAAVAGYRILSLKRLPAGSRPTPFDWAAAAVTVAASAALAIGGIVAPHTMRIGVVSIAGHPISVVAVAFGTIGVLLGAKNLSLFLRRPKDPRFWWYEHMRGMLISYIAAWTAFSAVVLSRRFGPHWAVWLWPTMVGVPVIIVWVTYYRMKFARPTGVVASAATGGR